MLLAGGIGSRLRPVTDSMPKCLVPIKGRPLLQIWLDQLLPEYISTIVINTHYLALQVEYFVSNSKWKDRIVLVNENLLLGTAGTLLNNRKFFSSSSFMVAHADNLSKFNVLDFIKCHQLRSADTQITMMTFVTDDPTSCGIVELDDENIVVAFHEKIVNPPSNLANAAIYIMEPTVLDFIASIGKSEIDIALDVLPAYLGKIQTFRNDVYHRDIGTIKSYKKANEEFNFE